MDCTTSSEDVHPSTHIRGTHDEGKAMISDRKVRRTEERVLVSNNSQSLSFAASRTIRWRLDG